MERKIGLRHLAHSPSGVTEFSLVMLAGLQREQGISWGESTARVTAYWRALGVIDEDQLMALTRQVMQRVDALGPASAAADLATLAIEETRAMLDDWLAGILDFDQQASLQQLAAARAALLGGAIPNWPAALLGAAAHHALVSALRKASAVAIPAPAELAMEAQEIRLFSLNLGSLVKRCLHFFRKR